MNWDEIRLVYKDFKQGVHPNSLYDWPSVMSPVERIVWGDIRSLGLPFYPQFPVSKYFLDFAEPVEKINIEVDGKNYHKLGNKKDADRDAELKALGWQVIRIQGWQSMKGHEHYEEECAQKHGKFGGEMCEEHQREYTEDSSEGILRKLKYTYYA